MKHLNRFWKPLLRASKFSEPFSVATAASSAIHPLQSVKQNFSISATLANVVPQTDRQTTLSELDRAFVEAEKIVRSTNAHYNIQYLLREELSVITQILRKLVGTNTSLFEVEKLYQSGSNSEHPIRSLLVMLMSKAAGHGQQTSELREELDKYGGITYDQLLLAKVVEMIHLATLCHKDIHNVDPFQFDLSNQSGFEQHLSNKTSVLFGDFFWAKAWKDLGDLNNIDVINMMPTVTVNISQGQFTSEIEFENIQDKFNLEYWIEKNFLLNACLPALGCKSALSLAHIDEETQCHAFEFGQNFGLSFQAYLEIQWFMNETAILNNSIDFCSLPVIMHIIETGDKLESFYQSSLNQSQRPNKNSPKPKYDIQRLHSIIRSGSAIEKSKAVMETFRTNALLNLDKFPQSNANDCLKKITNLIEN